jgi:hypothetical protein
MGAHHFGKNCIFFESDFQFFWHCFGQFLVTKLPKYWAAFVAVNRAFLPHSAATENSRLMAASKPPI